MSVFLCVAKRHIGIHEERNGMAETRFPTAGWDAVGLPDTARNAARLSVEEAASYCGVSTSYLNKMRCVGGGPAFLKLGRRVVYSTDDLDRWLSERRRASTSDTGEAA
jgi:hypothetical protein